MFWGFLGFLVGKFCASAGVGLLLQQGGPARITVRRHEHARLLTGLEPDYKPSPGRAGRRLCQACALTSRQRCLGGAWAEARSANSSANSSENTVTWPKSHRKSLAEMWIGGDAVPWKRRRKPWLGRILPSPPNLEVVGLFGDRVILLTRCMFLLKWICQKCPANSRLFLWLIKGTSAVHQG